VDVLREQGHLAAIDRHFAAFVSDLDGGDGPELALAAALASAWTRDGHACVALSAVAGRDWPQPGGVRLPDLDAWIAALDASPMVARSGDPERRPLVLDGGGRLYLDRLWAAETDVAEGLLELAGAVRGPEGLDAGLDRLFPGADAGDRGVMAVRTAACRQLCVVSGGPGTGKTTVAAAIVALLIELRLAAPERIVLAAPTGKAAARLQEAVRGQHRKLVSRMPVLARYEAHATTVHRWLHRQARSRRPIDALVLDESSMVDLTLMARVLATLPGHARLVLLGDASQLASVQPGAVFADVCRAGTRAGAVRGGDGDATSAESGVDTDGPGGESDAAASIGSGPDAVGTDREDDTAASVESGLDAVGPVRKGGAAKSHESSVGAGRPDGESGAAPSAGPGIDAGGASGEGDAAGPESSPLAPCVVELVRNWRFDETGGIGRLAAAVVRGDAGAAVAALRDPADAATALRPMADARRFERLATAFADQRFAPALRAMQSGSASRRQTHHDPGLRRPPRFEPESAPAEDKEAPFELAPVPAVEDEPAAFEPAVGSGSRSAFRVLCAHRVGAFGAERFNRLVERRLGALGLVPAADAFYPGRPILVTRNDPRTGLSPAATGIVVRDAHARIRVWFPELEDAESRPRLVAPARLPPHESFFAVTVHRAQGSEYNEVAVVLGPAESRVATRELLYTAVTRARRRVVVYGSEESVAAAVGRATERYSGLREALLSRPASTR